MKLKELQELMQKAFDDLEGILAKITEAEEAEDTDAVETAKTLHAEKSKEFDSLEAKVMEAKSHQKRVDLLKEVQDMSIPDPTVVAGKTVPTGSPAQPVDHVAEAHSKNEAFYSWIKGKKLDGETRKLITPKSERMQGSESADAVVIPDRLASRMMGSTYAMAFGKTMFSTATPAGIQTNPSAAQNLVPQEFSAVLQQLPFDVPSVLDRVTVVPSVTGTVTWPALVQTTGNEFGGVAFQWLGEGAEKPETEPEFEQLEISTHELSGYTEISERLLSRSSINLETLLATLYRGAMVYTIDNAILQGSGTGQPLGIVNTAGINLVTRNTDNVVNYSDLVNLKHAVKGVHRSGSNYVVEDSVEAGLELQTDTLGRPLFRASMANGPFDRLIGYPYIVGTNNPTLGTSGDIIFGNLRHYVLVMEEEITLARSEHVKFRENKVAFKVFTVVGGRLLQPRGMAILSDSAS